MVDSSPSTSTEGGDTVRALNSSPVDSIDETVLFPFDRKSMPFSRDLNLQLQAGRTNPAEMDHGLSVDLDDRHPEHCSARWSMGG